MCMSVPQIAVLAISINTSLGPTFGSGVSSSQMPGAACCLTSAFMRFSLLGSSRGFLRSPRSVNHAEVAPDTRECLEGALELPTRERRRHLGADARLALGHHRIGEADDVHPALEQRVRHAAGERRVPEHDGNDRVLAGLEVEARLREPGAEEARILE